MVGALGSLSVTSAEYSDTQTSWRLNPVMQALVASQRTP
jgi:hypothetical protein